MKGPKKVVTAPWQTDIRAKAKARGWSVHRLERELRDHLRKKGTATKVGEGSVSRLLGQARPPKTSSLVDHLSSFLGADFPISLNDQETELVELFRQFKPKKRAGWLHMMRSDLESNE